MSEQVWVCDAARDSKLIRGFWTTINNENAATSDVDKDAALVRKIEAGEDILKSELLSRLYHSRPSDFQGKLPSIFHSLFMVIDGEAADLIGSHDTGRAIISKLELYQNDQATKIPGDFFLLCPGNPMRTVDLEITKGIKKRFPRHELYDLPLFFDDKTLVTLPREENGFDIWVDPLIRGGPFFVSDKLAKALEKAGLKKAFRLSRAATS